MILPSDPYGSHLPILEEAVKSMPPRISGPYFFLETGAGNYSTKFLFDQVGLPVISLEADPSWYAAISTYVVPPRPGFFFINVEGFSSYLNFIKFFLKAEHAWYVFVDEGTYQSRKEVIQFYDTLPDWRGYIIAHDTEDQWFRDIVGTLRGNVLRFKTSPETAVISRNDELFANFFGIRELWK